MSASRSVEYVRKRSSTSDGVGPPSFWYSLSRQDGHSLTDIFLMNPDDIVSAGVAIVPLHHDRDLVFEPHHFRICCWQPEFAGKLQADMFVFGVAVEMARWRF